MCVCVCVCVCIYIYYRYSPLSGPLTALFSPVILNELLQLFIARFEYPSNWCTYVFHTMADALLFKIFLHLCIHLLVCQLLTSHAKLCNSRAGLVIKSVLVSDAECLNEPRLGQFGLGSVWAGPRLGQFGMGAVWAGPRLGQLGLGLSLIHISEPTRLA